jgi:hypothetical protein
MIEDEKRLLGKRGDGWVEQGWLRKRTAGWEENSGIG